GFLIAAAVMSLGGLAELLFGVRAEGRNLEDLATPLTAEDADAAAGDGTGGSSGPPGNSGAGGKRADGGPDPSQGRAWRRWDAGSSATAPPSARTGAPCAGSASAAAAPAGRRPTTPRWRRNGSPRPSTVGTMPGSAGTHRCWGCSRCGSGNGCADPDERRPD